MRVLRGLAFGLGPFCMPAPGLSYCVRHGIWVKVVERNRYLREIDMSSAVAIDWTNVVNFDNHGTLWGVDSVERTEDMIDRERANGLTIHEWYIADRGGLRHRIVRIADPDFLDTICVFPEECDDCGAPVTSLKRVSDEHHAKCPRRDPNF